MTSERCQFCDQPGTEWTGPSHQAVRARYLRCETCGHVWTEDRDLSANPPAGEDTGLTDGPADRVNIRPS